jgi:hypothetical protein
MQDVSSEPRFAGIKIDSANPESACSPAAAAPSSSTASAGALRFRPI